MVVVLPASMWAAMPMLRVHSSGKGRPGAFFAEVAYRPALVIDRGAGSEPLSGVVTALGYRLLLVR